MLPTMNIPQIMDDELFITYLDRLATNNGYRSTNDLLTKMLGEKDCYKICQNQVKGPYRHEERFMSICSALGLNTCEMLHLFRTSFIYPGVSPFLNGAKQSAYVQSLFSTDIENRNGIIINYETPANELRYCPACAEEELKKFGFMYYHTDNQLPGMRVCPKHRQLLLHAKTLLNLSYKERNTDNYTFCEQNADMDTMCEYASAMSAIFRHWPDMYFEDIRDLIFHTVADNRKCSRKTINDSVIKILNESRFKNVPESKNKNVLGKNFLYPSSISMCVALILILFGSIDKFLTCVTHNDEEKMKCAIEQKGFYTDEHFNSSAMIATHECGHSSITSYASIMDGFGCPSCESGLSRNDMIKKIVETSSSNKYSFDSDYKSLEEPVTLVNKQGAVHEVNRFYSYLYDGHRDFKNSRSDSEIQIALSKCGAYKLIRHDKAQITILHEKCGKSFTMNSTTAFFRHPFCRACNGERMININGEFKKFSKFTNPGQFGKLRKPPGRKFNDNEYFNKELSKFGNYSIVDHGKNGYGRKKFIIIQHNDCEGKFILANMTVFRQNPYCRICGDGARNLQWRKQEDVK